MLTHVHKVLEHWEEVSTLKQALKMIFGGLFCASPDISRDPLGFGTGLIG
jgi:hypothetical protein